MGLFSVKILKKILAIKDFSELTDRNVELYPQFFLELITTQLRFYMVLPQLVLLKDFSVNETMSGQQNKCLIYWHFEN